MRGLLLNSEATVAIVTKQVSLLVPIRVKLCTESSRQTKPVLVTSVFPFQRPTCRQKVLLLSPQISMRCLFSTWFDGKFTNVFSSVSAEVKLFWWCIAVLPELPAEHTN